MKIFIFGAGASLGSQADNIEVHLKAPLVDNIFDDQYHRYATDVYTSAALIKQLKSDIGATSLEEWLTKEWDSLSTKKSREALAAGRKRFGATVLYIWRLMAMVSTTYNDDNTYSKLLEKLAKEDDEVEKAFVSFNYDLLLDKALVNVYNYDLSGQLSKYTNVNYLKPHGSVNWFVPMRKTDLGIEGSDVRKVEVIFSRMANNLFKDSHLEGQYTILDPLNSDIQNLQMLFELFGVGRYGFPLVMLPLSAKMYDLVDGFLDRMNAEITRIFPQATEVYVIGYKGNDSLIKDMLIQVPDGTPLHIVGRENAAGIQSKLIKLAPEKLVKGDVHSDGFRAFVEAS